jgi:predicted alpha/beta-fold hydrolase
MVGCFRMQIHPYRPHPLLRSGHLQTLLVGVVYGERPSHYAEQIHIPLDDGEALAVHEELGEPLSDTTPLTILIHGLGGDHTSPYMQRIAHQLRQSGMRVWRVDLRGSGLGMKLAWRPAHAGASDDLAAVVQTACERYPHAPIHVVGFSLSGNIVLKMLGEAASGEAHERLDWERISSALAIAPPVDLHHCANNMERRSRRIYTRYYLKMLCAQIEQRKAQWPQWQQIPNGPPLRSIRQFDARYTAPMCGFADTDDYYTRASAKEWLRAIRTPTTLLVDRHDPIVTVSSFDPAHINAESTELILTSHGGHMGYFGLDAQGKSIRWMEYFVVEQLRAKLAEGLYLGSPLVRQVQHTTPESNL